MAGSILTTHQVARLCNVHHTTVINWINEGKLKSYATPGGHRRINESNLISFMKKYQIPIPEKLLSKKKVILIVDDDIEFLDELKVALSNKDFKLDFASNGFETGRKIYTKKPSLILLDFKIPGLDGFEVCKILHMYEETSNIPIFAVTVLNSKKEIKKIKACGVKEYIPKPVNMEKLIKSVKDILR